MRNLSDARKAFDMLADECAAAFGFVRRAPLIFWRAAGELEFLLLFGVRRDARGWFAASGAVGLRLPALDPLVSDPSPDGIHIKVPIHLVGERQPFVEWRFADPAQLGLLARDLRAAIGDRVVPFLGANGSIEAVRRHLALAAPACPYVLSPERRVELLAAVYWISGDRAEALGTVDAALRGLADAMPKKRVALVSLRSRFVADPGANQSRVPVAPD